MLPTKQDKMRNMIDLGSQRGPLNMHMHMKLMDNPTSIDCGRELRSRRSFRWLMECVVPSCCGLQPSPESQSGDDAESITSTHGAASSSSSSAVVTGTFFGYRTGKVSFCIQEDISSFSRPLLLLEFGVPTAFLAREMQHGLLRIALVECSTSEQYHHKTSDQSSNYVGNILKGAVWCVHCNGRKVGFAVRRELSNGDLGVLKLMSSVSVGAGVLPDPNGFGNRDGLLMYLRAKFRRVIGSTHSQSFHMINPDNLGNSGQDLSVFLLRSTN